MKKKGDHRPRNSAQYERVVELLIMHKAKRTPRKISLLPSVSRPRSIIRQLRKSLTFFTAIPVFCRFRGEKRKRRVQLSVCDDSGEMPCLCASEKEGRSGKTSNGKRNRN